MEATKSVFVETFGESPQVVVLDFFLLFDRFDYSKSQVARETGVSRVTLEWVWKELEKEKIISKSRKIGRAQMYKLNNEAQTVKVLKEMQLKLATAYAEKQVGKQELTAKARTR